MTIVIVLQQQEESIIIIIIVDFIVVSIYFMKSTNLIRYDIEKFDFHFSFCIFKYILTRHIEKENTNKAEKQTGERVVAHKFCSVRLSNRMIFKGLKYDKMRWWPLLVNNSLCECMCMFEAEYARFEKFFFYVIAVTERRISPLYENIYKWISSTNCVPLAKINIKVEMLMFKCIPTLTTKIFTCQQSNNIASPVTTNIQCTRCVAILNFVLPKRKSTESTGCKK